MTADDDAHVIAQTLFTIMVDEAETHDKPENFNISPTTEQRYRAKMRLYREAVILMLLLARVQKERRYEGVLQSFEGRILAETPTLEGLARADALRAAMLDLNGLTGPEAKERGLRWSAAWLSDIGHEESNPVRLTLFSLFWMDFYIAIAKSVKEL